MSFDDVIAHLVLSEAQIRYRPLLLTLQTFLVMWSWHFISICGLEDINTSLCCCIFALRFSRAFDFGEPLFSRFTRLALIGEVRDRSLLCGDPWIWDMTCRRGISSDTSVHMFWSGSWSLHEISIRKAVDKWGSTCVIAHHIFLGLKSRNCLRHSNYNIYIFYSDVYFNVLWITVS